MDQPFLQFKKLIQRNIYSIKNRSASQGWLQESSIGSAFSSPSSPPPNLNNRFLLHVFFFFQSFLFLFFPFLVLVLLYVAFLLLLFGHQSVTRVLHSLNDDLQFKHSCVVLWIVCFFLVDSVLALSVFCTCMLS